MSTTKTAQTIFWLKTLLFFLIMFGFSTLPTPEPLTPYGMKTLGIFFALLFGWCTIGMIWPSIVGILAMPLLGVLPLGDVFANGWGSSVMLLIFFMMMIAKNLEKAGISKFVALWFISIKIVFGRPWLFSFSFLLSISLVSSLTSAVAMIFLGWMIFYEIMAEINLEKYAPYANYMLIGTVIAACLGDGLFPFRTVGAVAFMLLKEISGFTLNSFIFTLWSLTMCVFLLTLYVLMGKFIFRIAPTQLGALNNAYFADKDLTLDARQKCMLLLMAALIVLMLAPSIAPADWFIIHLLNTISSAGVAALVCMLMCIIQIDGSPLMEPRSIIRDGVSFDVMFLGAAVLPLALKVFSSEQAGINAFIIHLFGPIVAGKSAVAFLILTSICALVLTNFMINVTVPTILFPAFYPIALTLGISPVSLMVIIVYSCFLAFLLPSASPMAAVMFGNSGYIHSKDIYKYGGTFILAATLVCCLGIPIVQLLF